MEWKQRGKDVRWGTGGWVQIIGELSSYMVSLQVFGTVCFIPSIVHINLHMYQVTLIYSKEKIDTTKARALTTVVRCFPVYLSTYIPLWNTW